jgi:chromatin remodeling complex protein RSC6
MSPSNSTTASKRQRKTKASSTPAPAPAPASDPAPAPASDPAPTPDVVVVPDVVAAPATTTSSDSLPDWSSIDASFSELNTRLQEFKQFYSSLVSDVKTLQKNVQRYLRDSSRKGRRRRTKDPNAPKREPSGFAKPAIISNELCSFLGKPQGTEMARTEVTKHLTQYIKSNSLQDESNRRKIIPDSKLRKLLHVTNKDEVTYFNLQKYMKIHFPKPVSSSVASA